MYSCTDRDRFYDISKKDGLCVKSTEHVGMEERAGRKLMSDKSQSSRFIYGEGNKQVHEVALRILYCPTHQSSSWSTRHSHRTFTSIYLSGQWMINKGFPWTMDFFQISTYKKTRQSRSPIAAWVLSVRVRTINKESSKPWLSLFYSSRPRTKSMPLSTCRSVPVRAHCESFLVPIIWKHLRHIFNLFQYVSGTVL